MKEIRTKNIFIGTLLSAILLSMIVLVPTALADPPLPNSQNITVQQAEHLIKTNKDVVVLDVRNETEYSMGHLHNAILIPLHELDSRVNELIDKQNSPIVVYCGVGGRSPLACQILEEYGFTKVYNMMAGMNAWMQANYPIDTTYHHVAVGQKNSGKLQIDIEPFLLFQSTCIPCNEEPVDIEAPVISDPTFTVVDEAPGYTKAVLTYIQEDTLVELTLEQTLIWHYNQYKNNINRTITFISTVITEGDASRQIYGLVDLVEAPQYNMSLYTGLDPLDSNTYSGSITSMSFVPFDKNETLSLERVVFNTPVTLSEQYSCLSDISKELAKEYKKSSDENINIFAERYDIIASEFSLLSNIVKTNLKSYDNTILESKAIIADDIWSCGACEIGLNALIGGGCIVACILTVGLACLICLEFGWAIQIIGGMGVSAFCASQGYCP